MRIFLGGLVALCFVACNTQNTSDSDNTSETVETAPTEAKRYKLTPFDKSTEYPTAKLESMTYDNGNWAFEISGDYELGVQTPDAPSKGCANSAKGQHIHLIVGAQPYVAQYVPEFRHEIGDDKHAVLAFLSRSYHESIKTPDAYIAQRLKISDGQVMGADPLQQPTLFYSRPKGVYEGDDTKRVMLDYYMVNTDPERHWVKADINGEIHELREWQPYYIDGLPSGDNTITLTLMDGDAVAVADNNPVARTFKLIPDPQTNE